MTPFGGYQIESASNRVSWTGLRVTPFESPSESGNVAASARDYKANPQKCDPNLELLQLSRKVTNSCVREYCSCLGTRAALCSELVPANIL